MYVRTISRHNKDGSTTTYVQLAHNVRDPKSGFAPGSGALYLWPRRLARCRGHPAAGPEFVSIHLAGRCAPSPRSLGLPCRGVPKERPPVGEAYLLRQLWERLGLQTVQTKALEEREIRCGVEWAIFAMVANRALE